MKNQAMRIISLDKLSFEFLENNQKNIKSLLNMFEN